MTIHVRHSGSYIHTQSPRHGGGGLPRRRNSTPEFRGETRARVVLIGGGGAVTGTVSSLFSWVWYAPRDWPPSHSVPLSVQRVLVTLALCSARRQIVRLCRGSRAKLATTSLPRTHFSTTPSKFFARAIDHTLYTHTHICSRPTFAGAKATNAIYAPECFTGNPFSLLEGKTSVDEEERRRTDTRMTRGESS